MNLFQRAIGASFVGFYRLSSRAWAKTFSLGARGAFASFGRKTVIQPPIRLVGERRIAIGSDVFVGGGSWLQVLDGPGEGVALEIGNGTSIAGNCVLSAAESVKVGEKVLFARGVYVADHMHAHGDPTRAILDQGIGRVQPVEIGDGAWLGENVVVGPGVSVGAGAVIGANSVVLEDVPPHCLAVGAPARVVRELAPELDRVP